LCTSFAPGKCFWSFFFQAEDGIRDFHVTGVQTCALPISGKTPKARSTFPWIIQRANPARKCGPGLPVARENSVGAGFLLLFPFQELGTFCVASFHLFQLFVEGLALIGAEQDRKSTRLNSS